MYMGVVNNSNNIACIEMFVVYSTLEIRKSVEMSRRPSTSQLILGVSYTSRSLLNYAGTAKLTKTLET